MHNRHIAIIFIALFALACYFPLFFHLDHMSLRQWDESRRGVNAYEMLNNGNLLVTYFDATADSRIPGAVTKSLANLDRYIDRNPLAAGGQFRWFEALVAIWWHCV